MGFKPLEPCSKLASVNDFVDHMSKGLEEAKSALSKAKDKYTLYYNCCRELLRSYNWAIWYGLTLLILLPISHP
jgi:hypothetical protein